MRLAKHTALLSAAALLSVACNVAPRSAAKEVVVFAAASLTDAFAEIEIAFEQLNPAIDIVVNYGASSTLRMQIIEGAPVDVFASANTANMNSIVNAGESATSPRIFALNNLEIAVPRGNPGEVVGLSDFANPDLLIGICAFQVPCGELGATALANAQVTPSLDTTELNVKALLSRVEAGELDAGLVYRTDIAAADGRVEGIPLDTDINVEASYPITVLSRAGNPIPAGAFVAFVLSKQGSSILARFGFLLP